MLDLLFGLILVFIMIALLVVTAYQTKAIAEQKKQIQDQLTLLKESNAMLEQAAEIGLQTAEICHNLNHFLQSRRLYSQVIEGKGFLQKNAVEQLEFSNKNMQKMVKEIQSLLEPDRRIICSQQNVRDTLNKAIAVARDFTGQDHVTIQNKVPEDIFFPFDDSFLEILNNIIINALQAMKDTPAPTLAMCIENKTLRIQDNGPGIPDEQRDKIFSQLFSTKGKTVGLGLGFIARRCRACGLKFKIHSNNAGTCFTLTPEKT